MANKCRPLLLLLVAVCCLLIFPVRLGGSSRECHQNFELKEADCKDRGLDSVPQSLSEDIMLLDLHENNINSLSNSSFKKYPLITHLDLSKNDISRIEPTAFYPMKDLKELYISENPHLVLPEPGFLRWASELSTLKLASSNLKWLPVDTLKWISRLDTLSLKNNQLSSINITTCGTVREAILSFNQFEHINPDFFNFACLSETLYMFGNPIKSIDPRVIASLHIRSLELGHCSLTLEALRNLFIGISQSSIENLAINFAELNLSLTDFFHLIRSHYLSILDFSYNDLSGLHSNVFSDLTQVNALNLNHNSIIKIEPDFFEGMQELRVLSVSHNDLEYVNSNHHTWNVDLVELYLTDNLLTAISPFTFLGLGNLELLDLSSNKNLVVFEVTSFSGLHNIQTIDLSQCSIYRWQFDNPTLKSLSFRNIKNTLHLKAGKSFKRLQLLEYLDLTKSTSLLQMWNATSNVSLFDGLLHLKILKLNKNNMFMDNGEYSIFRQLSALQELYLDNCYLGSIHPLLFATLESLEKLSLSENFLILLHHDLLMGLGQLKSIDLSDNMISHLDEALFSNNKMLTNISLSQNELTSLNRTTFTPVMTSLSFIKISWNPLNCQCDIKWLIAWLRGPVQLMDEKITFCSTASMTPLRDERLLDFDIDVLCRPNILPACLIPLAGICLVAIVILVYHRRWKLKHKLFLLKLAILGYKEMRDARDHNDYEFDLNIIFYDDDDEWVREHLRPAIEEHLPQFRRNVFGDEDLVLGMHYLDSVDYVVSHSYKTLILLSRVAVRDRWFMLKLRIAMDHVSDTGTEFVVVVFIEDIPNDEIPFLARLYLSDGRPYLYWPDEVRGHEYFWNELAKKLTINLRTDDLIPNE